MKKWLPAKTVRVIVLPAESRQEAASRGQTRQKAIYQLQKARQEAESRETISSAVAKYDGQSR